MILELIIALIIGVLIGTITGLTPGLHINLIITFLSLSFFEKIISSNPFPMSIFIVSLSITHIITDFIPSILLGAPEEDSYLSILPGHRMLLEGRGYEAITLCIYGSISSILFIPFLSIRKNNKIPNQIIEKPKIRKIKFIKTILSGAIITPFMSFLPGIGSGHSAVIASELKKQSKRQFLFLIGFIAILTMSLSFVAAYSIGKTRTGSAVAIINYLGKISHFQITSIILVSIFVIIISSIISIKIAKFFVKNISEINYNYLSIIIPFLIILINFFVSGLLGIFILLTSTSLGIYTQLSNSKKINLMGSLILPSIIFYIFN